MRSCLFLLIFAFTLSSFGQESLSRGDFGSFRRSLNSKAHGYEVLKDPTGTAPTLKVEKFVVKDGDCARSQTWDDCQTDRERSELSEQKRTNPEGRKLRYTWSVYLPPDYVDIDPAKVALGQFHQDGDGGPLWMFQLSKSGYYLDAPFLTDHEKYPLIDLEKMKGRWTAITVEVVWSSSAGSFDVLVNGERKVAYKGPTKQKKPVYFKYGLYRSFLSRYKSARQVKTLPTQEVLFSDVKRSR